MALGIGSGGRLPPRSTGHDKEVGDHATAAAHAHPRHQRPGAARVPAPGTRRARHAPPHAQRPRQGPQPARLVLRGPSRWCAPHQLRHRLLGALRLRRQLRRVPGHQHRRPRQPPRSRLAALQRRPGRPRRVAQHPGQVLELQEDRGEDLRRPDRRRRLEGVHVFDISNLRDPRLVASVTLPCGSHTLTVAGVSAGKLVVYSNNSSSSGCVDGTRANDDPVGDFMDVIAVPLADPAGASLLRREPLAGPTTDVRTGCHDAAVIRGTVNLAACASADTVNVWDVGANRTPGGSIEDPELLYTIVEPGVGTAGSGGRWHSAAFTWDGKVLVLGWEPGGGGLPECEATRSE